MRKARSAVTIATVVMASAGCSSKDDEPAPSAKTVTVTTEPSNSASPIVDTLSNMDGVIESMGSFADIDWTEDDIMSEMKAESYCLSLAARQYVENQLPVDPVHSQLSE